MARFDVYNLEKQKIGEIDLSDEIFAAEVNPHLLYEVVKMQQANRRSGTASVKTRGEVSGGGRKPWRQKGTGRARQGSIRASHWVGGGKAMGPKPHDRSYRPPFKVRRGALCSALSLRAREGQVLILEGFDLPEIKTKRAAAALAKLGLTSALVVEAKGNEKLHRSIRNLPAFDVIPPEGLNVESILRRPALVLTAAAAKAVEARLA